MSSLLKIWETISNSWNSETAGVAVITNTTKAKTDVQMKMLKVEVSLNVGDVLAESWSGSPERNLCQFKCINWKMVSVKVSAKAWALKVVEVNYVCVYKSGSCGS